MKISFGSFFNSQCRLCLHAISMFFLFRRLVLFVFLCRSVRNNLVVGCRFDPKNMHQCPQVVVLCGSGSQAAFAVNCARHLASRRIHLTVFVPNSVCFSDGMETELKLLDLNAAKLTTSNYKSECRYYTVTIANSNNCHCWRRHPISLVQ